MVDANNLSNFIKHVTENYIVLGQTVNGLHNLYTKICADDDYQSILSLVFNKQNLKITTSSRKFNNIELKLFKYISETIRISNGDYSELWFAIVYDGQVKGGVAMDNITSDVIVNGLNISLKNYKKISTVDFGTLPPDLMLIVNNLMIISALLLDKPLNNVLTRNSLNMVLSALEEIESTLELNDFLTLSRLTTNKPLKSISKLYTNILNGKNIEYISKKICTYINLMILSKIHSVDYWAIIVDNHIYIKESRLLYNIIKCIDNKISDVVSSFYQMKLFVNGNLIKRKIMEMNLNVE